jgi:hypothetical protein
MACAADQILAKPGMGVDEGMMVVGNEMARVQALASLRAPKGRSGTVSTTASEPAQINSRSVL